MLLPEGLSAHACPWNPEVPAKIITVCVSYLLCSCLVVVFETGSHSIALAGPKLDYVDQADLRITEIHLLLQE